MMKKVAKIALISLSALLITACGEKEPQVPEKKSVEIGGCTIHGSKAPMWACLPEWDNSYASVGIAEKSAGGISFMRKIALQNGRDELSQQIQTDVKNKMESFTRSTGTTGAESIDQVITGVSKQVSKQTLHGSKAVNYWESPTGAIYMLVVVPKQTVNEAAKESVKKSISSYKNDNALWQQFQSKQALESLDKEFPTD